MKGNEADGFDATGRSVRGGSRFVDPPEEEEEAMGVERVKAAAVLPERACELDNDDGLGCFFALGFGEGAAGVVEIPDEIVRFLDRLLEEVLLRDLSGDFRGGGGRAWEVALR